MQIDFKKLLLTALGDKPPLPNNIPAELERLISCSQESLKAGNIMHAQIFKNEAYYILKHVKSLESFKEQEDKLGPLSTSINKKSQPKNFKQGDSFSINTPTQLTEEIWVCRLKDLENKDLPEPFRDLINHYKGKKVDCIILSTYSKGASGLREGQAVSLNQIADDRFFDEDLGSAKNLRLTLKGKFVTVDIDPEPVSKPVTRIISQPIPKLTPEHALLRNGSYSRLLASSKQISLQLDGELKGIKTKVSNPQEADLKEHKKHLITQLDAINKELGNRVRESIKDTDEYKAALDKGEIKILLDLKNPELELKKQKNGKEIILKVNEKLIHQLSLKDDDQNAYQEAITTLKELLKRVNKTEKTT